MNPAPINRRGPINRTPTAVKTNSPPPNSTAKIQTGTKAPPTVRYNTLTTERIIATWKVKRGPTKDLNDDLGKSPFRTGQEIKTGTAKSSVNAANHRQANTPKTTTEVQKNVIETWKERRPVPKATVPKKESSPVATSPKKEITKSDQSTKSVKNVAKKPTEENNLSQAQESQVRLVLKAFEKNAEKLQIKQVPKKTVPVKKEEPKPDVKVVPQPVKKEEAKPAKKEEKFVVPIKKPSINVTVQPWKPETPKDIITSSVRPSLKKAESKDKIEPKPVVLRTDSDSQIPVDSPEKSSPPDVEKPNIRISIQDTDSSNRSSLEDQIDYNHPRAIDLAKKDSRTYWKDIPAVQESGVLEKLTKDERNRQEAKFELMFSEASYLISLNLLKNHYMKNIQKHIPQVIKQEDYNELFSYIPEVQKCSQEFLKELNEIWQDDIMLDNIYEVVRKYSNEEFKVYVKFCRKMSDMQNRLKELTKNNEGFKSLLELLVNRQASQKLSLNAFLTSPMQRITKLPLLMKTILDKLEVGSEEYNKCSQAYEAALKVAQECNDVVDENKKVEELLILSQQIDFPPDVRSIPIVVPNRYVVARGDVKHFAFMDRSTKKEKLKLILFSDLFLVAKKKSEKQFIVVDHCPRDKVSVKEMENLILYGNPDLKNSNSNPIIITMLNNSQSKKTDLMVTFKNPDMRKEWLQYLASESHADEENDSKQVIALESHEGSNLEELSFSPGDVICVLGDEIEGWCQGELLSDGSTGKFPISKTAQITSPKVRAANSKTRKDLRHSQMSDDLVLY